MNQAAMLPSTLSRLGRESDMLDTIVSMMGDERLDSATTHGTPRRVVVSRLAERGFELAEAVCQALGRDLPPATTTEGDDARVRFRESHRVFAAVAPGLADLDSPIAYDGMTLQLDEIVPQRIAEVVLANEAVSSLWSLDEADPDSVRDALDALVRRLEFLDGTPPLRLTTMEGDEWTVHGGGQTVHGTREFLAGWLAYGESDDMQGLPDLPPWV